MADPIRPIDIDARRMQVDATRMRPAQTRPLGTERPSFQDVLAEAVSEVKQLQNNADTTIKKVVSGEIKDVSEAIVAVQEADLAFQTMMTVRNRVLTAYEEIIRMQI
ncbi:MAG: flagellar hook-basal body complex protein FliE [Candidatus Hydrogenedentes bacterium]|nr:flagellar hook-basal body complex protein FliE [Candidatus Hydrogenedentota bacterium]